MVSEWTGGPPLSPHQAGTQRVSLPLTRHPPSLDLDIFTTIFPRACFQSRRKKENHKMAEQRHEEYQYLDLVKEILENGEHRPDRLDLL